MIAFEVLVLILGQDGGRKRTKPLAVLDAPEFRAIAGFTPLRLCFSCHTSGAYLPTTIPHWARGNFPRFAIPILPFVLLAFRRWIPEDRRVLWGIATVSSVLAACSALGITNVVQVLQRAFS